MTCENTTEKVESFEPTRCILSSSQRIGSSKRDTLIELHDDYEVCLREKQRVDETKVIETREKCRTDTSTAE
jgi:hypothetical protein